MFGKFRRGNLNEIRTGQLEEPAECFARTRPCPAEFRGESRALNRKGNRSHSVREGCRRSAGDHFNGAAKFLCAVVGNQSAPVSSWTTEAIRLGRGFALGKH